MNFSEVLKRIHASHALSVVRIVHILSPATTVLIAVLLRLSLHRVSELRTSCSVRGHTNNAEGPVFAPRKLKEVLRVNTCMHYIDDHVMIN